MTETTLPRIVSTAPPAGGRPRPIDPVSARSLDPGNPGAVRYLGPARVTALRGDRVEVDGPSGPVTAQMALAAPYSPRPDDVVLVIGGEECWVIGVLRSRGLTSLVVPGDLELRAMGRVELVGEQGVEIRGPRVTLRADKLETVARATFEHVKDSYRWVSGAVHTTAGRVRTLVSGSATLSAERIIERAKKDVKIDGERINLG
jgi:hypothetical protein